VVVRPRRALRAFLAAALLAAVGAASVVDGEAADFVGGDDGDALVARRRDEAALTAAATPRTSDVTAAPHRAHFVAALDSPRTSRVPLAASAAVSVGVDLDSLIASPPLPSRAPPVS
jgi:hypothetical protein